MQWAVMTKIEKIHKPRKNQVDQESLLAFRVVGLHQTRQAARSALSCLFIDWNSNGQPKQGILSHFLHRLGAAIRPR